MPFSTCGLSVVFGSGRNRQVAAVKVNAKNTTAPKIKLNLTKITDRAARKTNDLAAIEKKNPEKVVKNIFVHQFGPTS